VGADARVLPPAECRRAASGRSGRARSGGAPSGRGRRGRARGSCTRARARAHRPRVSCNTSHGAPRGCAALTAIVAVNAAHPLLAAREGVTKRARLHQHTAAPESAARARPHLPRTHPASLPPPHCPAARCGNLTRTPRSGRADDLYTKARARAHRPRVFWNTSHGAPRGWAALAAIVAGKVAHPSRPLAKVLRNARACASTPQHPSPPPCGRFGPRIWSAHDPH
jgi:hypothetical protein